MSAPAAQVVTGRLARTTSAVRCDRVELSTAGSRGTSVEKALKVLEVFRGPGAVLGISEVARRTELAKSTAHRLLVLLVELGYVEREGNRYALSAKLFELGNVAVYSEARSLRATAMPYMIDLLRLSEATVHLTSLIGHDLLFLEKVYGHRSASHVPRVGSRVPAAGTAPGAVISAFASGRDELAGGLDELAVRRLAEIRQHGFAAGYDDVHGPAAICFSAPISPCSTSSAIAALSVVLRRYQRCSPTLISELKCCAASIAAAL